MLNQSKSPERKSHSSAATTSLERSSHLLAAASLGRRFVRLGSPTSLNRLFHALADPTRRQILERLTRGSASVTKIAEPLDMSLSAVMQHLTVLRASGLVHSSKIGRVRSCQIGRPALRTAELWLTRQRRATERGGPAA